MYRMLPLCLCLTACATTYQRPADLGPNAMSFTLTPEQCAQFAHERRSYHATESATLYVGGAGGLVALIFAAVPAFRTATAAQGAAAGVSLAAGAVGAFTSSQVNDLDAELALGGCSR